ncbi:MAG TPA: hypothetical protein GX714_12650 [Chloroflexi bacterium]|nr:hypothetical protein [Chloroflexota bacterium]
MSERFGTDSVAVPDSLNNGLRPRIIDFLMRYSASESPDTLEQRQLSGEFGLYAGATTPDLYGMTDAVYVLHTVGQLDSLTSRESRCTWAERILACQGDDGWFTRLNHRGHPKEHATAYALGALALLAREPDEGYLANVRPIGPLLPLLTSRQHFTHWIEKLGFVPTLRGILGKNLGWHYIWRSSHIGGGVPAIIATAAPLFSQWWPDAPIDSEQWFRWYFEWLDGHINPNSGYWQRAIWNRVYHKPTHIDMGGAVHFYWIYDALGRPFPYPEAVIKSTIGLQRPDGLYADHPFCIDLDADFCIVRSFLQLPESLQVEYQEIVHRAIERNFEAIVSALTEQPLEGIYSDSHGLPGALAALVECGKLPGFRHAAALADWQHPLDKVCWL